MNNYKEDEVEEEQMEMTKENMLELALAQFTGYHLGNRGYSVDELVSSMGLTKEEWEKVKKDEDVSLDEDEIKEVNEHFEERK